MAKRVLAIIGDQGQIDGDAEWSFAAAAWPGQVGDEGGVDLAFECFEAEELGVEGLGVDLLAGDVGQAAAGLGDRGDRAAAAKRTVKRIVAVTLPLAWKSRCGWQKSLAKR